MAEFNVTPSAVVDTDQLLKTINSLSDLLKIELTTDGDNILLLRRCIELIVIEIGKLNQKVAKK